MVSIYCISKNYLMNKVDHDSIIKKKTWKGNVLVVIISFFLSIVVYSSVTTYTNFAADINNAIEWTNIESDVEMQVVWNELILKASRTIPNVKSLSMFAFYDTNTVRWTEDSVVTQFSKAVSEGDPWEATIIITFNDKEIKAWTEIMKIRVNGNAFDMMISDIQAIFTDDSSEPLSTKVP